MISENLKLAVKKANLVVKEVAELSGVSKGTIDNWLSESKNKTPRAYDLYAVCKALNITMEQAVDGDAGIEYVLSIFHLSQELTPQEQAIIMAYRQMTDKAKDFALRQFQITYEHETAREVIESAELQALSGIEDFKDSLKTNRQKIPKK